MEVAPASRTLNIVAGSKLKDYEVLALLHSGGMATLYLARRTGAAGFQRPVAIKVVHAHLARDPDFIHMFVDEALLSARIVHPNVVHVEELAEVEQTYLLVMEYVHGCSLLQLMRALGRRKQRLSIDLAAHIAVNVAAGLHAAHETKGDDGALLNVVHRDVSPQNILLSYGGHVKLIDFGIAKARGRTKETQGPTLKGKIRYMAPEQAHGAEVSRRTDIYALGIVLFEMLTSRRFFPDVDDLALLEKVRNPEVRLPSVHRPEISPELDEVVRRAVQPSPEDRFDSALAFRKQLLTAIPQAAAISSEDLASLLADVMATEISEQRRLLPEGFASTASMIGLQTFQRRLAGGAPAGLLSDGGTGSIAYPMTNAQGYGPPVGVPVPEQQHGGRRVRQVSALIAAGVIAAAGGAAGALALWTHDTDLRGGSELDQGQAGAGESDSPTDTATVEAPTTGETASVTPDDVAPTDERQPAAEAERLATGGGRAPGGVDQQTDEAESASSSRAEQDAEDDEDEHHPRRRAVRRVVRTAPRPTPQPAQRPSPQPTAADSTQDIPSTVEFEDYGSNSGSSASSNSTRSGIAQDFDL